MPGNLPVMHLSSRPHRPRRVRSLAARVPPAFKPRKFPTNGALFARRPREYKTAHWDNAVQGFERLTLDLSARDTLLPLALLVPGARARAEEGAPARGSELRAAGQIVSGRFARADDALLAGRAVLEAVAEAAARRSIRSDGDSRSIQFAASSSIRLAARHAGADSASLDTASEWPTRTIASGCTMSGARRSTRAILLQGRREELSADDGRDAP